MEQIVDKFEGKKRKPDQELTLENVNTKDNTNQPEINKKSKKEKRKKERKNKRSQEENNNNEERVDTRGGNWYNGKFSEKEDLKSEKFEFYYRVIYFIKLF